MAKVPVFMSFDYDHDLDLKNLLVGQAKNARDTLQAGSDVAKARVFRLVVEGKR